MRQLFAKIKDKLKTSDDDDFEIPDEAEEGYVELSSDSDGGDGHAKVKVRPFVLGDFSDIKLILDALREGYTIALVNIKPLKDKDIVELKRAVNKLKKTCDAIEGDIAGFGDDWIAVCPSFAEIHRDAKVPLAPAPEEFQ
jgi:SepF-like predicted cell division protein (DUF552 family)